MSGLPRGRLQRPDRRRGASRNREMKLHCPTNSSRGGWVLPSAAESHAVHHEPHHHRQTRLRACLIVPTRLRMVGPPWRHHHHLQARTGRPTLAYRGRERGWCPRLLISHYARAVRPGTAAQGCRTPTMAKRLRRDRIGPSHISGQWLGYLC
jgi:hypothetical protein